MDWLKEFGRNFLLGWVSTGIAWAALSLAGILAAALAGISSLVFSFMGALVLVLLVLIFTRDWRMLVGGFIVAFLATIVAGIGAGLCLALAAFCKFLFLPPGVFLLALGAAIYSAVTVNKNSGSSAA